MKKAFDTLSAQITASVQWSACVGRLAEMGVRVAVELLPGHDLSWLAREIEPSLTVRAVCEFADAAAVAKWCSRQEN